MSLGDALQHVLEVGPAFDAQQVAGAHERVDRRRTLGALVGSSEQPVLPADGDASDCRSTRLLSISRRASSRYRSRGSHCRSA
jgi:hypothetical protein